MGAQGERRQWEDEKDKNQRNERISEKEANKKHKLGPM